jgi:hypothetical protein
MSDRLLRPSRTSWATWVVINSLASSHKLVRALLSLLCQSILTVAVRQAMSR